MTDLHTAAKQALKFVVDLHPAFICEAMHHKKAQRHSSLEPCPHVETQKQVAAALREALANAALDKMAENARELGLDYEPSKGCDYCNHGLYSGTKCKHCGRLTEQPAPVQPEPYCWMSPEGTIYQASDEDVLKGSIPMYLGRTPAQQEPQEKAIEIAQAFSRGHDAGWESATAHHKALAEQPAPLQHFDHTVAANAALRDAQNRSYQIAKCKYPKCSYPCKDLPDCRDADQPAQQEPVAYAVYHRMGGSKSLHWPEQHSPNGDANEYQLVPLYTSPPAQRKENT